MLIKSDWTFQSISLCKFILEIEVEKDREGQTRLTSRDNSIMQLMKLHIS